MTSKLDTLLNKLSGDDRKVISDLISTLRNDEWLEDEIYDYCRCTEEVSPDFPELDALQQMTIIAQKVRSRKDLSKAGYSTFV